MKKSIIIMSVMSTLLTACGGQKNPFFESFDTPYGVPPFDKIRVEHYQPAFTEGMRLDSLETVAIATNNETPTFENTIEALDRKGVLLNRVSAVFTNLYSAETNEELNALASEVMPALTTHRDNIMLNEQLFARVKAVYEMRETLNLAPEQQRLLSETYKSFVRSGANLDKAQKERLRELNRELSSLQLEFGQNILKETNAYQKWITDETELIGLPQGVRDAAAEEAKLAGEEGKWLFTTQKSSFIPVLQYSQNRELRKELLLAYNARADRGNEYDNNKNINRIMQLRTERARMFGYESAAAFILDNTMAKTTDAVYNFLQSVWEPALAQAKTEAAALQQMMDAEGKGEKLEPWDWWYYAELMRVRDYALNEEELKPYFKMENVRQGAFDLATNLWGLQFKQLHNLPVYHPDVEVFEVTDADNSLIGILYTDYYPRAGKRAGAWMNSYTKQQIVDGVNQRPIITNVGNFTKPTSDLPSLLTMDEVETLFHEFGHALHGLLSQCTYRSLSGTSVARDFVELPSQVMENWCYEPQVMKTYAKHYQTGEVISDELIEKIRNAATFNQGFVMTELLSASILDMDYHSMTEVKDIDPATFEKESMERMGMIDEIFVRYRSTFFNHIFSGGYAAGYYSYTWAAVLDADAFEAFKETGDIYNRKIAESFRKNILERGGSDDPMKLYLQFRGKQPDPVHLLRNKGFAVSKP